MEEEMFFGKIRVYRVRNDFDMRKFRKFPKRIYLGDPNWTPPLNREEKGFLSPKKNPFFYSSDVAYFLAERDGRVQGRIAAIRNGGHENFHRDGVGFFGLFECMDRPDVANALFEVVADWLVLAQIITGLN